MTVSEYWIVRSSRTMTAVVRMVLEKISPTKDVRLDVNRDRSQHLMTLAATELAFRAAAVALLLVLAASLLADFRNVLAARLGAAFALARPRML